MVIANKIESGNRPYFAGQHDGVCRGLPGGAAERACLWRAGAAQPVDDREAIYGLIYNMSIDDDPLVRRLVLAENPAPSVIEDQRNNRLLPIEMSVLAVGYQLNGSVKHGLPPRPPLNLDPVELVTAQDDIRDFYRQFGLPAPHFARRRQPGSCRSAARSPHQHHLRPARQRSKPGRCKWSTNSSSCYAATMMC